MTDQALDDLARRVMLDAARQEYGDLIDELPEHDFSPEFERKMKRLVRRANHPIRYRVVQTAACLLLAALFSGCTVLAISPEAREAFVGWVREVYETYFVYHYTGEEVEGSNNIVYRPTWIPEGYELVTEGTNTFVYENDEKDLMSFFYATALDSVALYLESETVDVYSVFVGSYAADLYVDQQEGNANSLVWEDRDTGYIFWISAPLPGKELVKIAESVEVQEIPKLQVVYRPAWIPNDYQEVPGPELSGQVNIIYENPEKEFILFNYVDPHEAQNFYVGKENAEHIQVMVHDLSADLYVYDVENAMNTLVWTGKNRTLFWITAALSGDDLIKIAESVEMT